MIVPIFTFSQIFFNGACSLEKCGITPHCLYLVSLTSNVRGFFRKCLKILKIWYRLWSIASKVFKMFGKWPISNYWKNACIRASQSNDIISIILLRYRILKNLINLCPFFVKCELCLTDIFKSCNIILLL